MKDTRIMVGMIGDLDDWIDKSIKSTKELQKYTCQQTITNWYDYFSGALHVLESLKLYIAMLKQTQGFDCTGNRPHIHRPVWGEPPKYKGMGVRCFYCEICGECIGDKNEKSNSNSNG